MSEELKDEITSINSIYGDNTLTTSLDESGIYAFTLPNLPSVTFRLEFPPDYPNAPPSVLGTQSIGDDVAKGKGTELVDVVRDIVAHTYIPGSPCIFDVIDEAGQRIHHDLPDPTENSTAQNSQAPGQQTASGTSKSIENEGLSGDISQPLHVIGDLPSWTISEPIVEKKSVFVARAARVDSIEEARRNLAHLLATDKKVAKATHNITAWRVQGQNGVQFQDCDDDGETAAGGRLLHLLELMDTWNAMVVVTRWYGGIHLGPDRFRIINQVARQAIVIGGFVPEANRDNKKKVKK